MGVQTEALDDGYDVHGLFGADESQQLFRVMIRDECTVACLDEIELDQLSCGFKKLNLFGVIQLFTWRVRKIQYIASETDMVEDLLSVMLLDQAVAVLLDARRYVIRQIIRLCVSLTETKRIEKDRLPGIAEDEEGTPSVR